MILTDLQKYLAHSKKASLTELSSHFHTDADAIREMLKLLIRKQRVQKMTTKQCGGCHSCSPESVEFYEWVKK